MAGKRTTDAGNFDGIRCRWRQDLERPVDNHDYKVCPFLVLKRSHNVARLTLLGRAEGSEQHMLRLQEVG
jgi:hypothetical protein